MENFELKPNSAILISDPQARFYLTEVCLDEGFFIKTLDGEYVFADARYFSAVKNKLIKRGFIPILLTDNGDIIKFLLDKKIVELGLDYEKTYANDYIRYGESFSLFDINQKLSLIRQVKSKREIWLIKRACKIAQKAYYYGISKLTLGMTELELKDIIEGKMKELGAESPSFSTIVAFGKNGAIPHHITGKTRLSENTSILVDMGAKYKGYSSDLTRTCFFGRPNKEFLSAYKVVLRANEQAIKDVYLGISTVEADRIARDIIDSSAFSGKFTHSLGHGVGLDIHEAPYLSKKGKGNLSEGMVFTIEPGVYLDGKFGIRIEDTVTIENNRVKRLFTDGKRLKIIKK